MASINRDTKLVMAILFVGAVSGMNVYFYANYGSALPWSHISHGVLFSLITVGGIMGLKAGFDLIMNDRMELWLLDRKIRIYWEKKSREEQQRNKIMEGMRQNNAVFQQFDEVPVEFLEQ